MINASLKLALFHCCGLIACTFLFIFIFTATLDEMWKSNRTVKKMKCTKRCLSWDAYNGTLWVTY